MNNSEILNALYESDKELIIYRNSEKNNFEIYTDFVEKVKEQGDKNGIVFTYFCNDIPHQSGTTECGIYSLHFLTYMTDGGNFKNNGLQDITY